PARGRAGRDQCPLGGELRKVEVAMMIDEHQALSSFASSGSTYRGNTAVGWGILIPGLRRPFGPSAAKVRASASCPSRSSSLLAELGIAGCARMATCRTTSAVT